MSSQATITTDTPEATYTKLRSGEWGIRINLAVYPEPEAGSLLAVAKRSGETKQERVVRVLWTGDGYDGEPVALATIERENRGARSRSGKRHHPEYRTTSGGRCEDAPCCGCCS